MRYCSPFLIRFYFDWKKYRYTLNEFKFSYLSIFLKLYLLSEFCKICWKLLLIRLFLNKLSRETSISFSFFFSYFFLFLDKISNVSPRLSISPRFIVTFFCMLCKTPKIIYFCRPRRFFWNTSSRKNSNRFVSVSNFETSLFT